MICTVPRTTKPRHTHWLLQCCTVPWCAKGSAVKEELPCLEGKEKWTGCCQLVSPFRKGTARQDNGVVNLLNQLVHNLFAVELLKGGIKWNITNAPWEIETRYENYTRSMCTVMHWRNFYSTEYFYNVKVLAKKSSFTLIQSDSFSAACHNKKKLGARAMHGGKATKLSTCSCRLAMKREIIQRYIGVHVHVCVHAS